MYSSPHEAKYFPSNCYDSCRTISWSVIDVFLLSREDTLGKIQTIDEREGKVWPYGPPGDMFLPGRITKQLLVLLIHDLYHFWVNEEFYNHMISLH